MEKIRLDKLLSALTEAGFELVFLEDKIHLEGIITLQIIQQTQPQKEVTYEKSV